MPIALTKKEKGFVKDYLDTGNGVRSVLNNYDTEDYASAGVIACQNLKKLRIQNYLADHAEDAASMVYELSQHSEQDNIRLSASKDILDRAGYGAVSKSESKSLNVNVEADISNKSELETIRHQFDQQLKARLMSSNDNTV